MDLTNVHDLQIAMRLAGIKPSKGLGQHFLIDNDSLRAVINAGELRSSDTVLEIGPGLGVMTLPLTREVKRVVAIEADEVLSELLSRDKPDNLEVIGDDIMRVNLAELSAGYKVVANIPYYLTSKIFRLLLESSNPPAIMSLLIQKEVAERIVAGPGQMSVLALSVQYYGQPKITEIVEKHKFWPAPKVDSAVLQVKVSRKPAFAADRDKLFRLIKAGFGEKRKMLKNSLAGGLNISLELATNLISGAKLPQTARAQELSLKNWESLYKQAIQHELL
jgi:16S rRNA (adenine1518-N6/adenine1519-N6)-dimethyltransferase